MTMTILRHAASVGFAALLLLPIAPTDEVATNPRANEPRIYASTFVESDTVVLVAKRTIEAGTLIDIPEEFFELKTVPRIRVAAEAVRSFEALRVTRIVKRLSAGESPLASNLRKPTDEFVLPAGMRVFEFRYSTNAVPPFPGHKVDVIWVYRKETGQPAARTIVHDVDFVSVELIWGTSKDGNTVILGEICTLVCTPEDVAKLAAASTKGVLHLDVRPNP
jgi:Flp pilus assembly protein CpaB